MSCSPSDGKDFHGFLYFASGNYVGRFDMRDGSSTIVANLGDVTIEGIDNVESEQLLLSMVSFVGDREMTRIGLLDVRTGNARDLFAGTNAVYLSSAASIVYNDGTRFSEVSLRGQSKSYLTDSLRRHGVSIVLMAIDEEAVVFSVEENGQAQIRYSNLVTGENHDLSRLSAACSLDGAVWISSVKKLACKTKGSAPGDQAYALISLDGVQDDPLIFPPGTEMSALTYVGNQDLLILVERRDALFGGRDKWSVWGHDLSSGSTHKLSSNQYLGSSVVYRDH